MPDYLDYRRSISSELLAVKNRVRNFVEHWAEDGRYKEVILKRTLLNHLPSTVGVGTGFIIGDSDHNPNAEKVSSQIDIIIYNKSIPLLFQIDDFVIVPKEAVLGIIEVKTNLEAGKVRQVIETAHSNGLLINNPRVFNGIFSFENSIISRERLSDTTRETLMEYHGFVNNICFGSDYFMKYWREGHPSRLHTAPHYSFYKLDDLSFGYFISNLVEDCFLNLGQGHIGSTLTKYLYPIEDSKEIRRIQNFEIVIEH